MLANLELNCDKKTKVVVAICLALIFIDIHTATWKTGPNYTMSLLALMYPKKLMNLEDQIITSSPSF